MKNYPVERSPLGVSASEIVENAFALNPDVIAVLTQRGLILDLVGQRGPVVGEESNDDVEQAIFDIYRQLENGRRPVKNVHAWTL